MLSITIFNTLLHYFVLESNEKYFTVAVFIIIVFVVVVVVTICFILSRLLYLALSANLDLLCIQACDF